jgi:orotidine-5'-phosphate decarboxylase
MKKMEAKDRLILALDVEEWSDAVALLDKLEGKVGMVKVNSLAAAHPQIVLEIRSRRIKVWRDWKHKDIPGTVANYIKADVNAGLSMTTVHSDGGKQMMEYAAKAAAGNDLKILGITVLTSFNQGNFSEEIRVSESIQDQVIHLAKMAEEAGLHGVVASPKEGRMLRSILKPETLIVTPGIKPAWAVKREDQARVATPYQAVLNGADYIVVGSAIYRSDDPKEAVSRIIEEIERALNDRGTIREIEMVNPRDFDDRVLTEAEILHWFDICNAFWMHDGNFQKPHAELTSGMCSNGYVNSPEFLKHPNLNEVSALQLARRLRDRGVDNVDWVIGSPYSGITFSYEVAKAFGAIHGFTEKNPEDPRGKRMLWRRMAIPSGANILQIEELITTSGTFREVRRAVIEGNPEPVNFLPIVGALVHRPPKLPVAYEIDGEKIAVAALVEKEMWAVPPSECPLCKAGSPRYKPKSHWQELTGKK